MKAGIHWGMLWTADSVTAYYDDVRVPGVITYKTAQTHGFYWIFNMANHDNTAPPAQAPSDFPMQIDWVRVWQRGTTAATPDQMLRAQSTVTPSYANGALRINAPTTSYSCKLTDATGRVRASHTGIGPWTTPASLTNGIYFFTVAREMGTVSSRFAIRQ